MKEKILHNFGLKMTTLFCAFVFWHLITSIADPVVSETFRDIQVTMINEEIITDQGKVYQIVDGTTVNVIVKGKTSLLRQLNREDLVATADFESIELSSLVPIQVSVNKSGYESVEAVATPNNIKVSIEDSTSKKFPITALPVGELEQGLILGELKVLTETVTISGPESVVDKIFKVEARVNVDGISENTTVKSELIYYDENNLMVEQTLLSNELTEAVEVEIIVLNSKTVPINLVPKGEPKEGYQVVEITLEPAEILVYGDDEKLNELLEITIDGDALSIEGKSGKVEKTLDVTKYLPEGIYLFNEATSTIAVTVQIDELGTKTLNVPVQSITVHNNPENLTLEYNGVAEVALTLSGSDEVLDDLTVEDIRLSIDLKSYIEAGEYKILIEVTTIDGCKLVDDVSVPIKLTNMDK